MCLCIYLFNLLICTGDLRSGPDSGPGVQIDLSCHYSSVFPKTSLCKFFEGISKVKSAPAKAFQSSFGRSRSRTFNAESDDDGISMSALETIVESLLEIMEVK